MSESSSTIQIHNPGIWASLREAVMGSSQDFTEGTHADVGPLILANFFLERSTETVGIGAVGKHHAAAAAFKSVAANEFGMFFGQVAKSG